LGVLSAVCAITAGLIIAFIIGPAGVGRHAAADDIRVSIRPDPSCLNLRARVRYYNTSKEDPATPFIPTAIYPSLCVGLAACKRRYGNPHSRTHRYGWDAEESVEIGRKVQNMAAANWWSRNSIFKWLLI